jgi:hypothetical protein
VTVCNLPSEKAYLVSVNMSVCLESFSPCVAHVVVFTDAKLPKPTCDWETGLVIPGKDERG